MKKIIFISILIVFIGFIFQLVKYSSLHKYNYIDKDKLKLDGIFKHDYLDSIDITTAVGNSNDTLFQIKYGQYCLLVCNFYNYFKASQNQIQFESDNKNKHFYFTPYSENELSPILTMLYKLPNSELKEISINLFQGSEVYDSIYYHQVKGYCMRTNGFGIGSYKERNNIIFNFKEEREVVFMFYTKKIFIFYSYDRMKIDQTVLINMLL